MHPNFLQLKKVRRLTTGPYDHCTNKSVKLIVLKYFSLPFTLFEPCGAVFIINSTINLRKNSSNEYFKAILYYFRVLYTLGCSMNALIFFFVALAEVQVAVSSAARISSHLSNRALLRLQPAVICLRNTLRFAGDSPTYSKQKMNKMSPSYCLESQNAR